MSVLQKKPVIAVFDFDGTLTRSDSLIAFIIHSHGLFRFIFGLLWLSPRLLLFKMGFIDNQSAKERMLKYFFAGWDISVFNQSCSAFRNRIFSMLRVDALTTIREHQALGHTPVIISASFENWIRPWAEEVGIQYVLASRLATVNNIITGKIEGRNCYGTEKVNRLLEQFPDRSSYQLIVYGDSRGDREIMEIADSAHLVT